MTRERMRLRVELNISPEVARIAQLGLPLLLLLSGVLFLGGGFSLSLSTTLGVSLGGRLPSSPFFCAKAPAATTAPNNIATRIFLTSFISTLASSRLSQLPLGRGGELRRREVSKTNAKLARI